MFRDLPSRMVNQLEKAMDNAMEAGFIYRDSWGLGAMQVYR